MSLQPLRGAWLVQAGMEGRAGCWDGPRTCRALPGGQGGPTSAFRASGVRVLLLGLRAREKLVFTVSVSPKGTGRVPHSPRPPRPPGAWGSDVRGPQPPRTPLLGFSLLLFRVCPTAWPSAAASPGHTHSLPRGLLRPVLPQARLGCVQGSRMGVTGLLLGGCCVRRDS